jgi:Patatin-like phospholipase
MEILIEIPPWVVAWWEYCVERAHLVSLKTTEYSQSMWAVCFQNQRNFVAIALSMFLFWPFYAYCFVAVTTASAWIFWLFASVLMGILQMCYVTYQFCMIAADIFVLTLLKTYQVIMRSRTAQFIFFFSKKIRNSRIRLSRRREWRKQCEEAKDYDSFLRIPVLENIPSQSTSDSHAEKVATSPESKHQSTMRKSRSCATMETLKEESTGDESQKSSGEVSPGRLKRRSSMSKLKALQDQQAAQHDQRYLAVETDLGTSIADLLLTTTEKLKEERIELLNGRDSGLEFLLSGVVKRNHLTLEDLLVYNARSVAVSGQYLYSATTRKAIAAYYHEVRKGLEVLADESSIRPNSGVASGDVFTEIQSRIKLLRKMKQNMGRTALMLSGGGAQAMYHLGTIRALIQSGLYSDIKVISGTSGGSIAAACCAMFTPKEIFDEICVSTVSTDYRGNGEMKRRNIRWFPPMVRSCWSCLVSN